MTAFIIAICLFVGSHLILARDPIRAGLIKKMGVGGFRGLYTLISLATFGWMLWTYPSAQAESSILWQPSMGLRDGAVIIIFFAFILAVPGLLTRNPTLATQESALKHENAAYGMTRVTRHPFMFAVVVWGMWHAFMTGYTAAVLLFGGMAVLAAIGMVSIDRKRASTYGDRWATFAQTTSRIPFLAIIKGHNHFSMKEIGLWRLAVGVIVFAVVLYYHQAWFGKSPLPGGMSFY